MICKKKYLTTWLAFWEKPRFTSHNLFFGQDTAWPPGTRPVSRVRRCNMYLGFQGFLSRSSAVHKRLRLYFQSEKCCKYENTAQKKKHLSKITAEGNLFVLCLSKGASSWKPFLTFSWTCFFLRLSGTL